MLWRFIMLRCPCTMAVTYKKLFHLLSDKGMTNADLMEKAGFSANIITRIKRDLQNS